MHVIDHTETTERPSPGGYLTNLGFDLIKVKFFYISGDKRQWQT